MQLIVSSPQTGRNLRYLITRLLKSGLCFEVKRLNYVASYTIDEQKKIVKKEEKLLMLFLDEDKKQKLVTLVEEQGCRIISE